MRRFSGRIWPLCLCAALAAPLPAEPAPPRPDDAARQELHATLALVRERNAQDYAVTSAAGIDDARFVELGGLQQWITIRGEDRRNPVVLFLHGGPGDATNPWGYATFRPWLRRFTVVQWDQRGSGRTLGRNGPGLATLTLARLVQDGLELSEWLRQTLGQDKLVLVGHSAGSLTGVLMAKARPDLFHAYVGTGQVADPARSCAVAYAALLKKARALGDQRAVRELEDVGPPPYRDGRGYRVQRRWSNRFEGADVFIASTLALALGAPGYTEGDVNDWLDGQGLSAERLVPQIGSLGAQALVGDFAVPVFVIQGAEDFTTPTSLAEDFLRSIRSPRKAFVRIHGAGHFAVFTRPGDFLAELEARVLPLLGGR